MPFFFQEYYYVAYYFGILRKGGKIFEWEALWFALGSGANPASYTMGTGGSFPGGKARPGRDADHLPPSSAEVKKEMGLYLLSPKCASMERKWTTFLFYS
jgi:hypothetical protein